MSNKSFSQCFEIESILVDACDNGADEGYNEMFRMKIGANPLNTSNLSINWPAQSWLGLVQNATTATKVNQLNAAILAAGGCGQILEPTGGVLPANATVVVVTSPNLDTTLNSFGALTSTIYMLFQNTPPSANAGHFGNYNATPALRTLSVTFGTGCSDSVSYQRANLVNINGTVGGSISDLNGSTVNFTPSGTASYINNGCIAPVQPFTVDAGNTPLNACPGQSLNLTGIAQGQATVSWSTTAGNFSAYNTLNTTFTVPSNATSGNTITITLTVTNSCGATKSDQITVNVTGNTLTLNSANNTQTICSGNTITPIQYTFGGGATGATVTGLPTGVTATTTGNTITITGTPTSAFSYTISTTGGCGTVTLNGSVSLSNNATLALDSANNTQTICAGNTITPIQYTFGGGATGATVTSLPTGVTATTTGNTITITGTPTSAFSYTISTTGGCGTVTLNGSVSLTPYPGQPIPLIDSTICSGDTTNLMIGISPFTPSTTLNWQVIAAVNVTGANSGSGIAPQPINDILTSTLGGYVIYRITSTLGNCTSLYTDYRINVNPQPTPILKNGTICVSPSGSTLQTFTLDTGLNDSDYNFLWYDSNGNLIPGATNATFEVDQIGTYSVIAIDAITGCTSDPTLTTATATITQTIPASSLTVIQSDYFSENATITANVLNGTGTLQYYLDEGPIQSSNVFTNVSSGTHIISVIDTDGCTFLQKEFLIIDYPKFFTPNGDGYNDTWNISTLNQPDAKLYIFDRYGKLIKQLSPTLNSNGWDGTYNEKAMPSTDYWFLLEYKENGVAKEFKAHFSLKR